MSDENEMDTVASLRAELEGAGDSFWPPTRDWHQRALATIERLEARVARLVEIADLSQRRGVEVSTELAAARTALELFLELHDGGYIVSALGGKMSEDQNCLVKARAALAAGAKEE